MGGAVLSTRGLSVVYSAAAAGLQDQPASGYANPAGSDDRGLRRMVSLWTAGFRCAAVPSRALIAVDHVSIDGSQWLDWWIVYDISPLSAGDWSVLSACMHR